MNSISGLFNRPTAIQFGGNSHSALYRAFLPPTPVPDVFVNIEENEGATPPPARHRAFLAPTPALKPFTGATREVNLSARHLLDDSEDATPPQIPNREELSPLQRRLVDEFNAPTASFPDSASDLN